ncbi:MAG: PEP-CTERM sorting domain-containing protein [Armatimonadia bacterium]
MTKAMFYLMLVVAVAAALPASAATLLADHFGVNPTVVYSDFDYQVETSPGVWETQTYGAYAFDPNTWVPTNNTATADYQVNDWYGAWDPNGGLGNVTSPDLPYANATSPSGDEPYDTEAYYFDDDEDNLYFVAVIGFPSPADGIYTESRLENYPVVQGDLAIDVVGHGNGQTDGWGFQYSYGVDLTNEIRPDYADNDVEALRSETVGNAFYETSDGWYIGTPNGAVNPVADGATSDAYSNFDPTYSGLTPTGYVTTNWYELPVTDSLGNPQLENQWSTYVIEVTIPRELFGTLDPYQEIRFHWLAGCRNDGNDGQAYLTGNGVTPEPTTTALMLLGVVPLGSWLRKRRQSQS